jgi:hypothetical protein
MEAAAKKDAIADVETRAQPAPYSRRTLGFATHASFGAVSPSGQPPEVEQPQPGQEVVAPLTAPTRALQKRPASSEATRALAAASTAHGATKPVVISGARKPKLPAARIIPRRIGPRSFLAQFLVAMLATAMVGSALALSTPLGDAASLSAGGSLQALTNAAPWLPTPTPTPKPHAYRPPAGANPGQQAIINEIVAIFGANAQGALNISRCESGYDPNAWNSYPIMGSHASGVFQILYPSTWNTTSYASQSPFNADANIHAAYEIFHRDGDSWREWQCKTSGHV